MTYPRFHLAPTKMLAGPFRPQHLVIELTTRCNAQCVMCGRAYGAPDACDMDLDTYRYVIDHFPGKYVNPTSFGECLLHPQIVDAVAYATVMGKTVKMVTNGSLLDRQLGRALLLAGVRVMRFSVDAGDAKTYRRVRPGLSWRTLVQNVAAFRQERDRLGASCRIVARVTETPENRDKRKQIKAFWTDHGADRVWVRPEIDVPEPGDVRYVQRKPRPCKWPITMMTVKATGDMVLCCNDWWGAYAFGNVHDAAPMDLYNNEAFNAVRRGMATGQRVPVVCTFCDRTHRRHE